VGDPFRARGSLRAFPFSTEWNAVVLLSPLFPSVGDRLCESTPRRKPPGFWKDAANLQNLVSVISFSSWWTTQFKPVLFSPFFFLASIQEPMRFQEFEVKGIHGLVPPFSESISPSCPLVQTLPRNGPRPAGPPHVTTFAQLPGNFFLPLLAGDGGKAVSFPPSPPPSRPMS